MAKQSLIPLHDNGKRVTDLFVDKQTSVVYFLKSIGGRKYKFSTRVRSDEIQKAKRIANTRLKEILGHTDKNVSPLIKDELPLYLKAKESEGLDPGTLRKIKDAIKRIEPFWGSMLTNEINRENVIDWFEWLDREYPGQQKENPVKYMRNFAGFLAQKQHLGRALLPAVPKITDPDKKRIKAERKRKKGRILTAKEFRRILDTAESNRDRTIALIMYTMATRATETVTMEWGREIIETPEGLLYRWSFGQNKADHEGEHYFNLRAAKAIRELRHPETKFLFPQLNLKRPIRQQQVDWTSWRKRAGLDWHWTSHTFRHTCLSNLFSDAKNPQALICKLYRVSLAVALDVYIKPTREGILQMRDAIEVST